MNKEKILLAGKIASQPKEFGEKLELMAPEKLKKKKLIDGKRKRTKTE